MQELTQILKTYFLQSRILNLKTFLIWIVECQCKENRLKTNIWCWVKWEESQRQIWFTKSVESCFSLLTFNITYNGLVVDELYSSIKIKMFSRLKERVYFDISHHTTSILKRYNKISIHLKPLPLLTKAELLYAFLYVFCANVRYYKWFDDPILD